MPAHMCGIFGHKPSGSIVPSKGHFPDGGDKVEGVFVVGPMTRTVRDAESVFSVLAKSKISELRPVKVMNISRVISGEKSSCRICLLQGFCFLAIFLI